MSIIDESTPSKELVSDSLMIQDPRLSPHPFDIGVLNRVSDENMPDTQFLSKMCNFPNVSVCMFLCFF